MTHFHYCIHSKRKRKTRGRADWYLLLRNIGC